MLVSPKFRCLAGPFSGAESSLITNGIFFTSRHTAPQNRTCLKENSLSPLLPLTSIPAPCTTFSKSSEPKLCSSINSLILPPRLHLFLFCYSGFFFFFLKWVIALSPRQVRWHDHCSLEHLPVLK